MVRAAGPEHKGWWRRRSGACAEARVVAALLRAVAGGSAAGRVGLGRALPGARGGGLPLGAVPEPGRAGPRSRAALWMKNGGCKRGLCAGSSPQVCVRGSAAAGRAGMGLFCRCLRGDAGVASALLQLGLPQWIALFRACSCHRTGVFYSVFSPEIWGRRVLPGLHLRVGLVRCEALGRMWCPRTEATSSLPCFGQGHLRVQIPRVQIPTGCGLMVAFAAW